MAGFGTVCTGASNRSVGVGEETMRRLNVLVAVSALALAACGGGDDDSSDEPADEPAVSAVSEPDAESDADADADADAGTDGETGEDESSEGDGSTAEDLIADLDFGDGLARVTVGDTQYEFALGGTSEVGGTTYIGVCQTLFGLIAGGGYDSAGGDVTIEFEIPPPDWETYDDGRFDGSAPRIEIEMGDDGGWIADLESGAPAGSSQIDEWQSDGQRASGTATFIELAPWGQPVEGGQVVSGTFELGCGDG